MWKLDLGPFGFEQIFYDRSGKPNVRYDEIGKFYISTVFLGINHNFSPSGPPIIFETMIFVKDDLDSPQPFEDFQTRYATEDAAIKGHEEACDEVRKFLECSK